MQVMDVLKRIEKRWRDKNPVRSRKAKTLNSIEELRVIVNEIPAKLIRDYVYSYFIGVTPEDNIVPTIVKKSFRRAALRAGYDYMWGDFKHSINKLRCWVLQNFDGEFGNTLFFKSKSESNPFGAIHLSPLDERPPVVNNASDSPAVDGVSQLKPSKKGQ